MKTTCFGADERFLRARGLAILDVEGLRVWAARGARASDLPLDAAIAGLLTSPWSDEVVTACRRIGLADTDVGEQILHRHGFEVHRSTGYVARAIYANAALINAVDRVGDGDVLRVVAVTPHPFAVAATAAALALRIPRMCVRIISLSRVFREHAHFGPAVEIVDASKAIESGVRLPFTTPI